MDKELFDFQKNALLGKISGEPLCSEYKQEWRSCGDNKEMLVKFALKQQSLPFFISSCYRKLGLSKENILKNYSGFINGNKVFYDCDDVKGYSYELYVGYKGIFKTSTDVMGFMWCSNTHITIESTKCPVLYLGCDSHIHLSLDGYNCPRIYLFDDSKVTITDSDEDSRVLIYRYSDKTKVEVGKYCLADVRMFNKELKL